METPRGDARWPRKEISWTAKTTFEGFAVKPASRNLDMTKMLVKIGTVNDEIVLIYKFKLRIIKDHFQQTNKDLGVRGYSKVDSTILE
jgi:hypothetical protein